MSASLDAGAAARLRRVGGTRLLREMAQLFLQHGPERLAAADHGLHAGALAESERAWHSLKSSAAHLGAAELQEAAQEAERAAAAGDAAAALMMAPRVTAAYAAAAAAVQQLLEELRVEEDRAG